LETLLREAELEPAGWTRALYAPPLALTARWADGFETLGATLWPAFSGVILVEAVKQTFAVKPKGKLARRPVFAIGGLNPAPAALAGPSATGRLVSAPRACGRLWRPARVRVG
jgi:hypothetical protein